MLDSRAFGARMTGLGLGLDSRLCGNDEGIVDSRLCGWNDGNGSVGGGCVLATGCEQGGAKNQAQEGYCRLPIADCRLPIADCRLPIADCDSTATAFAVKLFWLVCVMSFPLCYANGFCHRQKPLYPKKPEYQVFL